MNTPKGKKKLPGFRFMTREQKNKMIKEFQDKFQINYVIDPKIDFDQIPLPFRNRMFTPSKRKKFDPIAFEKIGNKIHTIY